MLIRRRISRRRLRILFEIELLIRTNSPAAMLPLSVGAICNANALIIIEYKDNSISSAMQVQN